MLVKAFSKKFYSSQSTCLNALGIATAPPIFRSIASTTYASRTNTTVTAPAGILNNDILIGTIFLGLNPTAPTPTAPSGFTLISSTNVTYQSFNGKMFVYWKRASSESGSYTFTHSAASSQGVIAAYSGAITSGSPIDVFSTNTGSGATTTATTITTTFNNEINLYIAHDWEGLGTLNPPTGMSERFDGLVYISDVGRPTAGATGNRTQTNNNDSVSPWGAMQISIRAL